MKLFEILDSMPSTERVEIVEDSKDKMSGYKKMMHCATINYLYEHHRIMMHDIEHCEVVNLYPLPDNYSGARLLIAIVIER